MIQTPGSASIEAAIVEVNRKLGALGCRFALVYADMNPMTGQMGVRIGSNLPTEQVAPLLGSLLEPGEKARQMLADLFKAHPLQAAVPPPADAGPDAQPTLVEVPTEKAVEIMIEALLTNLQLKGVKKPSAIIKLSD